MYTVINMLVVQGCVTQLSRQKWCLKIAQEEEEVTS